MDTREQLARLKQRVAAIDAKYSPANPYSPRKQVESPRPHRLLETYIDEWAQGGVVSNEAGEHFQTERLYPANRRHGSADIGALNELAHNAFEALAEVPSCGPERWAFLDTETTGLAGGSGTYAFLIGVGRITAEGFVVRQFFMREYAEERSMLLALEQHLAEFDVLVTYNGKTYDAPLLETRYRMHRRVPPLARMAHVDLLHGARRLWKLRMESCRLMHLEEHILGFCREGDIAGELIPYVYFEFVRTREACRVIPVLHHNAMDIVSLACLCSIVPAAFRTTCTDELRRLGIRRGEDLYGIARWLQSEGESEPALQLLRAALDANLPDRFLSRALWDIAQLERKAGRRDASIGVLTELAGFRNPHQAASLEELAKYYEHVEKNHALALEFTRQAFEAAPDPDLLRRKARLEKRLARTPRKLV